MRSSINTQLSGLIYGSKHNVEFWSNKLDQLAAGFKSKNIQTVQPQNQTVSLLCLMFLKIFIDLLHFTSIC